MRLLRTIRLDPSDTFVFERAADPGEWAVSGAFAFWNDDAARLEGKARSAFRGAFLGVESLGWSTLVQIVEAGEADRAALVETLARQSGVSRTVLAERFAALVGIPPMQYVAKWRMQIAAELLTAGSANMARIAAEVGYESEASFSRAFKKMNGVSPSAWRLGVRMS